MSAEDTALTVVIPYFQEVPGILRRSVVSALKQEGFDDFEIVVVDDSSPIPASADIADLLEQHPGRIRVVKRSNGGCGAARNTGMDSIPRTRRFVAFLDSDDEWEPHHLRTAVDVLERGYDFFFANLFHRDRNISAFERERQQAFPNRLRPEEMKPLAGLPDCFGFEGDMFDRALFSGNKIAPPTVVYRFDRFPDYRYQEGFRCVGEEYLFFAGIAKLGARFAFSERPAVHCGHGVNVFENSGWGTPRFLQRVCDEITYRKYARATWEFSPAQQRQHDRKLMELRTAFALAGAGHLRRLEFPPLKQVFRLLKVDPLFPIALPAAAMKKLRGVAEPGPQDLRSRE